MSFIGLKKAACKISTILDSITRNDVKYHFCSGIITAAGSGMRMGGISKQLISLFDKEVICYSIEAFEECEDIDEIIIVAKVDEIKTIEEIVKKHFYKKVKKIIEGGPTRQESVSKGFFAINKKSEYVAIHDGARPLITPTQISSLLKTAYKNGASCAAYKIVDTLKLADKNDSILKTVDRTDLWAVQTPQIFRCDIYNVSLALAKRDEISVTDDCSLVEHAKFPIKLIDTGKENIKLTTKDDIVLVENLLKARLLKE